MKQQDAIMEQFLQQMNVFNRAVLNTCESTARSFADPAMLPRERFECGCSALEALTQETLRLESQWLEMVDHMARNGQAANDVEAVPAITHMLCDSMNEGVKTRAKLWEDLFTQLRRAETLIPDNAAATGGNPFEVWQVMTRSLFTAAAESDRTSEEQTTSASRVAADEPGKAGTSRRGRG